MPEFSDQVFDALIRSSVFVTVSAVAVLSLLKLLRIESIRIHSFAWLCVLLQGLVFVSLEVEVPLLPSQADANSSIGLSGSINIPASIVFDADPSPPIATAMAAPSESVQTWTLPQWLLCSWLTGCVVIVGTLLVSYIRFLRSLGPTGDGTDEWNSQWNAIQIEMNVHTKVKAHFTADVGPAICWTPTGYRLLLPAAKWNLLSDTQRESILRHEIAHYQRNDLRNALLFRLMATVHWFNPFAWLAVRKLAECAEWSCDETVRRRNTKGSTEYVRALMELSTIQRTPGIVPAASGHSLIRRAKRLLNPNLKEDHGMKKLTILFTILTLVAVNVASFELVAAQEPVVSIATNENAIGMVHFIDTTTATDSSLIENDSDLTIVNWPVPYVFQAGISVDPTDDKDLTLTSPKGLKKRRKNHQPTTDRATPSGETAVIDMAYVFKQLPTFQDGKIALQKEIKQNDVKAKTEVNVLRALEKKLQQTSGEERAELSALILERKTRLEVGIKLVRQRIGKQESELYSTCYKQIQTAIAAHAKENGIRIVRRATMRRELKKKLESGDPKVIMQAMNEDIVYVADEGMDITDAVLERLKNKSVTNNEKANVEKSKLAQPDESILKPVAFDFAVPIGDLKTKSFSFYTGINR